MASPRGFESPCPLNTKKAFRGFLLLSNILFISLLLNVLIRPTKITMPYSLVNNYLQVAIVL